MEYNDKGVFDGFEEWHVRELYPGFFYGGVRNTYSYVNRVTGSFYSYYGNGSPQLRAVNDNQAYSDLTTYRDLSSTMYRTPFINLRYVPKEGDTIYFTPGCKFPRSKIKRNFKWTASLIEADVAVLPSVRAIELYKNVCLFFLDETKEIFILKVGNSYNLADDCPKIGQTINDYVEHRKSHISLKDLNFQDNIDELKRIGSAECRYFGNVISYDKIMEPVIDAVNGIYPKIIFEDDLLQFVNTDGLETLTADLVEPLDMQINSNDSATRCCGLKVLASLDYKNKPSVAKYLLRHIDNWKDDAHCSTGVEFMCKTLNISLRNYRIQDSEIYGYVNSEESPVMREIIERECRKMIESDIKEMQRYCNLEIHVDSTITVE